MNELTLHTIESQASIRDAVKKMDVNSVETLIVIDNEVVIGLFTMGDFRRSVLDGIDINSCILNIANDEFIHVREGFDESEISRLFRSNRQVIDIPVLDIKGRLKGLVNRNVFFEQNGLNDNAPQNSLIPVIIMAGGKGTRMAPFTHVLPKPLIPIGDKPVIQVIMENFKNYGFENYIISINDKGNMIKAYFHDHELSFNISYLEEDRPLGTAGALLKLKDKVDGAVFVSNCDILIHADYLSVLDFHNKNEYGMTIVASMRRYVVPYGVCELDESGDLNKIIEKPESHYLVNTGLYIINSAIFDLIPEDSFFDMTDLITKAKEHDYRIGVYPVSEKSWKDVGQWTEYKKSLSDLRVVE